MVKTVAKIDGMMCGMCEAHMNDAVRKDFEVKKVISSHKTGETVIISENPIDETKLTAAVEATGYKLVSVSSEPYEKKGLFGFGK